MVTASVVLWPSTVRSTTVDPLSVAAETVKPPRPSASTAITSGSYSSSMSAGSTGAVKPSASEPMSWNAAVASPSGRERSRWEGSISASGPSTVISVEPEARPDAAVTVTVPERCPAWKTASPSTWPDRIEPVRQ